MSEPKLRDLFPDAALAAALDKERVIRKDAAVLESEAILVADSAALAEALAKAILEGAQGFQTLDASALAPPLPKAFCLTSGLLPPHEITSPRQRIYLMDRDFALARAGVEIRMESKNRCFCQTAKWSAERRNGVSYSDATLDRMEQKAYLSRMGFSLRALPDDARERIARAGLSEMPRPVLCLTSQRIRIPYRPDGNPETLIELAVEPLHVGVTFDGFAWQNPKIELEIKKGPANFQERHALLQGEKERLFSLAERFSSLGVLRENARSSAAPGFEAIVRALKEDGAAKAVFDGIDPVGWPDVGGWTARADARSEAALKAENPPSLEGA